MKKLFLILCFMAVCSVAFALPEIATVWETDTTTTGTTGTLVKASAGAVYSFIVGYNGVVAGDMVQLFNSATSATTTASLTIVAAATAGTLSPLIRVPAYFNTGIYEQSKKSNGTGTFYIEIQSF
jgi:Na+/pantothenate symporter